MSYCLEDNKIYRVI